MYSSSQVDLSESRQGSLYAADTVTYVFALTAVGLRFWSRRIKKIGFWLDDWLVLAALFGGLAALVNFYWWIPRGYGRHREYFGPDVDYYFFLGFFIAELTYTFIIVFVKYSILALYWRIFGHTSIKLPVWILTFIVTSWGIATLFLSIFTCVPPAGFWDKSIEAHCGVNSQQFLFGISIPNILTDVALLALPIRYIVRLNAGKHQKRLLVGTFLLGGFVCIASILRFWSVATEPTDPDFSWNWVNQGIWAIIESNFAIISACLPTLRPVWIKIFKHGESTQASNKPSRLWTVGSTGLSQRSRRRWPQNSSTQDTIAEHPFTAVDDSDSVHPDKPFASPEGQPTRRMQTEGVAMARFYDTPRSATEGDQL